MTETVFGRRRLALSALFCLLTSFSPQLVDAAAKPRCTADERLCPIEYGSTRFICVDRDSVFNCGGCSANGSGQNCELLDAAAVGCSRDGQCMACNWAKGGYDPQGYDDELVCETAEQLPFSPPPKRQDLVQAVKAPTFVHQLTGRQTPNSPFYFGPPINDKAKKNPVARMAAAAPWAAAKPNKAGGQAKPMGGAAVKQPARAPVHDPMRREPAVAPPVPKQAGLAAKPPVAPNAPKAAVANAFDDYEDGEEWEEGDEWEEDFEDELPPRVGGGAHPAAPKKPQKQLSPRQLSIRQNSLYGLPSWLLEKIKESGETFETDADLLAWIRQVNAERPRTPAQARKRTNAERFALDLPPLPPVNQRRKEKPGDAERQRQRERRMELEELRAKAELQAFREGRDPDEAIAAVRLPPIIDEKKEKELNEAIDRAVSFSSFDELPSDLARNLRSLIEGSSTGIVAPAPLPVFGRPNAGGGANVPAYPGIRPPAAQQHVLGKPMAGEDTQKIAKHLYDDDEAVPSADKDELLLDDEDEPAPRLKEGTIDDHSHARVDPPAPPRKGPLAAQKKKEEDENAGYEFADSPSIGDPPALFDRSPPPPAAKPKAQVPLPAKAKQPAARVENAAGRRQAVLADDRPELAKDKPIAAAKQADKTTQDEAAAVAMGQPFVKAMQEALGPDAWATFLAALRAGGDAEAGDEATAKAKAAAAGDHRPAPAAGRREAATFEEGEGSTDGDGRARAPSKNVPPALGRDPVVQDSDDEPIHAVPQRVAEAAIVEDRFARVPAQPPAKAGAPAPARRPAEPAPAPRAPAAQRPPPANDRGEVPRQAPAVADTYQDEPAWRIPPAPARQAEAPARPPPLFVPAQPPARAPPAPFPARNPPPVRQAPPAPEIARPPARPRDPRAAAQAAFVEAQAAARARQEAARQRRADEAAQRQRAREDNEEAPRPARFEPQAAAARAREAAADAMAYEAHLGGQGKVHLAADV